MPDGVKVPGHFYLPKHCAGVRY